MNVMVDIETLDVKKTACILSIGAVTFDPYEVKDVTFYRNISIESNVKYGRTINGETVEWWFKQDKKAQDGLFNPKPMGLLQAMDAFTVYIKDNLKDKNGIWVNGANFDLTILRDVFLTLGMDFPWEYKQECCIRALRKMGPTIDLKYADYKEKTKGTMHNALDDAKLQAQYVVDFWKKISQNKK